MKFVDLTEKNTDFKFVTTYILQNGEWLRAKGNIITSNKNDYLDSVSKLSDNMIAVHSKNDNSFAHVIYKGYFE